MPRITMKTSAFLDSIPYIIINGPEAILKTAIDHAKQEYT